MSVAILGLTAASSQAAVITVYNSQALWTAAVAPNPITTENFADATLETDLSIVGGSVSISGGLMNDIINDDAATSTTFTFSMPTGILGFGGGFFDLAPGGAGTGILVNIDFVGGGSQLAGSIPNTTTGFWGFTSDVAFSAVRFSEGASSGVQETYTLDDLQFAVAPAVPEPASLLLFGAAAAALAAHRRQRKI